MKKTLIVDCDGVIYPMSDIPLAEFVGAMKNTAQEFGFSTQEYNQASQVTLENKSLGMFNFIKELCNHDDAKFENFCENMFDKIDYSKIKRDDEILKLLEKTKVNYNVVILTNNHLSHLEKVLDARFGKNTQNLGIDCYDIRDTLKDGVFLPKQTEDGLTNFANKIDCDVGDCILVDDARRNLNVAEKMGMPGVLINESNSLSDYLQSLQINILNTFQKDKEY